MTTPDKPKVGRPSSYSADYIETVLKLGAEGKSQVQIAVGLGVPRTTMLSWASEHPEFSTALTRAKELEQDWWETAGQLGMLGDKFNAAVWKKSMEARFREDYTDRSENHTTLAADTTIAGLMERIATNGRKLHDKG